MNYYNEHDAKAAAWLQELINEKLIPNGKIDTRDIQLITPTDLVGFTQCHFFAGIGGWPLALQLAGWPASKPVWTGSCPCQPFSVAGDGLSEDDERHLWPDFRNLICQCGPATVFGEQVASALGRTWLSGVFADLERMAYRRAGADLCAASIGSPNIRQRLFWVAHRMADPENANGWGKQQQGEQGEHRRRGFAGSGTDGSMADTIEQGLEGHGWYVHDRHEPGRLDPYAAGPTPAGGNARRMADKQGRGQRIDGSAPGSAGHADEREQAGRMEKSTRKRLSPEQTERESRSTKTDHASTRGIAGDQQPFHPWRSILIPCRDGKTRRIPESGIFPLAPGFSSKLVPGGYPDEAEANATGEDRTTRLRGYGNAINPYVAAEFIMAAMESIDE